MSCNLHYSNLTLTGLQALRATPILLVLTHLLMTMITVILPHLLYADTIGLRLPLQISIDVRDLRPSISKILKFNPPRRSCRRLCHHSLARNAKCPMTVLRCLSHHTAGPRKTPRPSLLVVICTNTFSCPPCLSALTTRVGLRRPNAADPRLMLEYLSSVCTRLPAVILSIRLTPAPLLHPPGRIGEIPPPVYTLIRLLGVLVGLAQLRHFLHRKAGVSTPPMDFPGHHPSRRGSRNSNSSSHTRLRSVIPHRFARIFHPHSLLCSTRTSIRKNSPNLLLPRWVIAPPFHPSLLYLSPLHLGNGMGVTMRPTDDLMAIVPTHTTLASVA